MFLEEGGGAGLEKQSETVTSWLLEHYGLPGLVIILLIVWVYLQDKQKTKLYEQLQEAHEAHAAAMKAEQDARINDAKAFTTTALGLQSSVIDAVNKLGAIFEALKTNRRI